MKITILGAGTCVLDSRKNSNQYPPAFLVEFAREKILFECSEGIRFQLKQAGHEYTQIKHLAISHAHPDHLALLHHLQSIYCKGIWFGEKFRLPKLHIYCPSKVVSDYNKYWDYHLVELNQRKFPWPQVIFHKMSKTKRPLKIGPARLSSTPVYHGYGKCDALAFRLKIGKKVLAYSGDTGFCPGIKKIAKNADIFICEASAKIGSVKSAYGYGHLTPYAAGQIAKAAHVKKLVLIHYYGIDSKQAMLKDCQSSGFCGKIIIAKDFEKITL